MKSDAQLVQELKGNNYNSMSELHARYFDRVYQRCLSITNNEADAYDCANDALLISFEKISSFREEATYSTWLYAIATNYTISFCKKRSKQVEIIKGKEESFAQMEEFEIVPNKDISEIVAQILDAISVQEKELLIEKYSYKTSIEELQVKYGLGASAIKMRLARAKQKVQQMYVSQFAMTA